MNWTRREVVAAAAVHGVAVLAAQHGMIWVSTGLSVARRVVEARSLASPFAAFAMRSAVAGAATTRSAACSPP